MVRDRRPPHSLRRAFAVALALACLPVAIAGAQTGTPPGSIGIRLLEAPRSLAGTPRARVYVIDHLNQGDTIHRRIEVSSGLDHRERLSLYAAGALVSGGRFRFLDDRTRNELSGWITVRPTTVVLEPRGTAVVDVTIAVPRHASDGERYAVVWAETPPSAPSSDGLLAVGRVGIRVYLSVGRGGAPPVDFAIESMTASRDGAGRPIVSATVVNTGGRAIDVAGTLRLSFGPAGLSAGPVPVELGTTIGIGQRAPVRVVLPEEIPDGPWTASLRLRADEVERRAEATLTFPSGPGARSTSVAVEPDAPFPWLVVVFSAIGGAVGLFLLIARRRRQRDQEPARPTQPDRVPRA